uniref:Uncharacterized protein n=1 Tax=Timema tahoe TaxID=61484 RepID=A0A7R9IIB4_9NEOP|nr:unnamed protein product [Timema tahoe]
MVVGKKELSVGVATAATLTCFTCVLMVSASSQALHLETEVGSVLAAPGVNRSQQETTENKLHEKSETSSVGDRTNKQCGYKTSSVRDRPNKQCGYKTSSVGDRTNKQCGYKTSSVGDRTNKQCGYKTSSVGDRPNKQCGYKTSSVEDRTNKQCGYKTSSVGDRPNKQCGYKTSSVGDRPNKQCGYKTSSVEDRPNKQSNGCNGRGKGAVWGARPSPPAVSSFPVGFGLPSPAPIEGWLHCKFFLRNVHRPPFFLEGRKNTGLEVGQGEWRAIWGGQPPSTHPIEIRTSISPVIDSLVNCESSALDHAATEAAFRTCALLMAPRLNFLLVLQWESAGDWRVLVSIAIEAPGFTSQAGVAVRCFCNLAQCVMSSYMCKSQGGGCFSDLTGYLDVYKARHGCVEMLERERQRQCHSPRPPLLCCYKDMCNHVDSPEARLRFNETFIGLLNASEGTRIYNSQQSNANNEIWFKAATIAVPICGAIILVVLIALAIKILRKEQDRFVPSSGRKPLQHFEHNVNTFSKKVPLLMLHHNEGVPPNMVFHPQDCPSSSLRFEKNETNAKLNVTTVKPNRVQPNDYTLLVPSTQLNLQKTNNINNNLYRNVNLAFAVPATHPLPPVNNKLYDKQRLAEVSSWGDASASASHV